MSIEVQNDTISQTQSNDSSEPIKNDNNMLNELLSSILSQSINPHKTKSPLKDIKVEDEHSDDESEDESEDESGDESEDESEDNELISNENDLRWIALSKLLDSHLRITKSFLHLVRED